MQLDVEASVVVLRNFEALTEDLYVELALVHVRDKARGNVAPANPSRAIEDEWTSTCG